MFACYCTGYYSNQCRMCNDIEFLSNLQSVKNDPL